MNEAERQVGERLSEQATKIAESISAFPLHSVHPLAVAYLAQARQLAEAERENGNLREALEYALEWSTDEDGNPAVAWRNIARAALNPPDPPASPAKGSEEIEPVVAP